MAKLMKSPHGRMLIHCVVFVKTGNFIFFCSAFDRYVKGIG